MAQPTECGLCHCYPKYKSTTPCEHIFCRKCIDTFIEENIQNLNCPTCEEPFGSYIHSKNIRCSINQPYPGEPLPPPRKKVARKRENRRENKTPKGPPVRNKEDESASGGGGGLHADNGRDGKLNLFSYSISSVFKMYFF